MQLPALAPLEKLLLWFAAGLALWILATSVRIATVGWVAIPITDDWLRWITYVSEHYSPGWFYEQQVDHRLTGPKLIFAIDHLAFHARAWFTLACSFCLQALTGILLWRLLGRAFPQNSADRLLQAALLASCLFSSQQWVNLVMPFQVQFPMVYCAAAAALFALWKATEASAAAVPWLAASMLMGALATYSMANGVLIWPVLVMAAWWFHVPKARIAVLAAVGGLLVASFFYGWHQTKLPYMSQPHGLAHQLTFALAFLGSPAFPLIRLKYGIGYGLIVPTIPGAVAALALVAGLIMFWRNRERYNSARTALVFYCLFVAGSCATIVFGRSQAPLTEAYQWRYLTPMYLLWVCGLLTAWPALVRLNRTALYAVLDLAILLAIAAHQLDVLQPIRDWVDTTRPGEASLVDNVVDPDAWLPMFQPPQMAMDTVEYLRNQHLSVFAEDWTRWPGMPLTSRFLIDRSPNACRGQFDEPKGLDSFRPGWRLTGWAWDAKAGRSPRRVVLADDRGLIAGVAVFLFPSSPESARWIGYVSGQPRPITAYMLEADERSLCAIGTRKPPLLDRVLLTELGPPFPETAREMTGSWHTNGYYQGPGGPGAPPVEGVVFGSHPPDAGTGTLRLGPFHLDGRGAMAIPLVTGPDSGGLSVVVRDFATKEVLAKNDALPHEQTWWAWRPNLPQGRDIAVEVIAEDKGTGWGQWMALGWPHGLRQ